MKKYYFLMTLSVLLLLTTAYADPIPWHGPCECRIGDTQPCTTDDRCPGNERCVPSGEPCEGGSTTCADPDCATEQEDCIHDCDLAVYGCKKNCPFQSPTCLKTCDLQYDPCVYDCGQDYKTCMQCDGIWEGFCIKEDPCCEVECEDNEECDPDTEGDPCVCADNRERCASDGTGDDIDNDCDGDTDEGCKECVSGSKKSCTTDGCPGEETCELDGEWGDCVKTDSLCGTGEECVDDAIEACTEDGCPGTKVCDDGEWGDCAKSNPCCSVTCPENKLCDGTTGLCICKTTVESCGDSVDNDCDGQTDEECQGEATNDSVETESDDVDTTLPPDENGAPDDAAGQQTNGAQPAKTGVDMSIIILLFVIITIGLLAFFLVKKLKRVDKKQSETPPKLAA